MDVQIERFAQGELDDGVLFQTLGSAYSDVAVYSVNAYGGVIREEGGIFSTIPAPPTALYGTTFGACSPDKLFAFSLREDDMEETVADLLEWNGSSWVAVVDGLPALEYGEIGILGGDRRLASHNGVVYFMRVQDRTFDLTDQHYRFQVYSWDGASSELVDDVSEPTEGSIAFATFLYIRRGKMYVTTLMHQSTDGGDVSSVKVWQADPGQPLQELYFHEWPNDVPGSGVLYTFALHPVDNTTLWEIVLPYNLGTDNTLKLYVDPDNNTQREAVGDELTIGGAIPFAGGWIGSGSMGGRDGLFWRSSWSPPAPWELIPDASSVPNGPFDYSVDTPLWPVPSTDPAVVYAGGARVDETMSLWNFKLRGDGPGPEPEHEGAPILRAGPISRVISRNTQLLQRYLTETRDVYGDVEGNLILDSNGCRMIGLVSSADPTAIKIREE